MHIEGLCEAALLPQREDHILKICHVILTGIAGWGKDGENQGTVAMVNPKQVRALPTK